MTGSLSTSDLFRREEKRSEKLVNYARILITLLYFAAGTGVKAEIPASSLYNIYAIAGLSLLYSIVLFFVLLGKRYHPAVKYVSATVDVLLLAVALYSFGTFRTFKTEAFLIYFLWIALAAMRFSVKLTIYTGILCVLSYLVLILLGVLRETIQPGSITEHFTSARVSVSNQGLRLAFLTACFSVSAYVARLYRGLVAQSVENEMEAGRQGLEKERVKDTLSRYVSHQIAEKILTEGMNLSGERRNATILFCDIRDFTRMSEKMEPEEVTGFLNEYLRRMVDVIFEYGGTLDKFVGDEIMAIYGVPVSTGRDEEMAVRTAMRMKEVLADMNERRAGKGRETIRFGIGIHTGEVVAGNIGSHRRLEYTVIGQTVNMASRIEALNKFLGTDILITEQTYAQVHHLVDVEKQRLVRVKGIEQPIQTYRIIGQRSA